MKRKVLMTLGFLAFLHTGVMSAPWQTGTDKSHWEFMAEMLATGSKEIADVKDSSENSDPSDKKSSSKIADSDASEHTKSTDEEKVVLADDPTEEEKESFEESDKKEDSENHKKETKEKEEKSEEKKEEALFDINAALLSKEDFAIHGVELGQSVEKVSSLLGNPISQKTGAVRSEYGYKNFSVRFVTDLAAKYDSSLIAGADALYVTGKDVKTHRGISVGSLRENVLRLYGRPSRVLWDGAKDSFFFVYQKEQDMLIFTVKKGKVQDIRISYPDDRFAGEKIQNSLTRETHPTEAADFSIAGYRLKDLFAEHSWQTWLRKANNPKEEIIYYPGYGVNTEANTHRIQAIFLTDPAMLTPRGVTVGDRVSTLEAIYGAPEKVEVNHIERVPQTAYIYFAADKEEVLIFYINDRKRSVQSVVVMPNPLGPQVERMKINKNLKEEDLTDEKGNTEKDEKDIDESKQEEENVEKTEEKTEEKK